MIAVICPLGVTTMNNILVTNVGFPSARHRLSNPIKQSKLARLMGWIFALYLGYTGNTQATVMYWNLFNDESNSTAVATYATYATLDDMLNGTNILSTYIPNGAGFANQVVGSGAFFTPDGGNSGNGGGTVPEPPSVLLFGLGMLGLMWNKMRS